MSVQICEECGLPILECNALAAARRSVEQDLRRDGYRPLEARAAANRLILPVTARSTGVMSDEELGRRFRDVLRNHTSSLTENVYGPGVFSIRVDDGYEERLRTCLRAATRRHVE